MKGESVISVVDIVKEFPGVKALGGISFDVKAGEIHCLVGENGAGKSTLMKVLSGAYEPTSGKIIVEGKEYDSLSPALSRELGISIVYQENDLVPAMDVVENIYVGSEITRNGVFVDKKAMREKILSTMKEYGISIDIDRLVEHLSVSDQQFVKILKALSFFPKVLILDEPTSMFNTEDSKKVLDLVRRISGMGIGVIYISHFLEEVVSIADRITVIRDGSVISTYDNSGHDTPLSKITNDMVGRPVDMFFQKDKCPIGDVCLEIRDLQLTKDSPKISFSVRKGEILGVFGMVGAGRTEIMRAITGADPKHAGRIIIDGNEVSIKNPSDSIRNGFAFITEDRQALGLMLSHSVLENSIILALKSKIKGFFMSLKKQVPLVAPLKERLIIKTPSLWTEVGNLSGGNQQKTVLAKWLMIDQRFYIFDEPTRGIDVNAKAEFYKQMSRLTAEGKSIIMVSSDMAELISMSDRVLVVRSGRICSELEGEHINEKEIIREALGVEKENAV